MDVLSLFVDLGVDTLRSVDCEESVTLVGLLESLESLAVSIAPGGVFESFRAS